MVVDERSQGLSHHFFKGLIHSLVTGSTGTGKSTIGEAMCEVEYVDEGMKIVDLQNNKYMECIGFCRPNRIEDLNILNYIAEETIPEKIKSILKNGFPIDIYHPIVKNLPARFPDLVKLYALPLDMFAYEEVLRVLTNDSFGYASYVSLAKEIKEIRDEDSFPVLLKKIVESVDMKVIKSYGMGKVPLYTITDSSQTAFSVSRPLNDMIDLGIFCSRNFKHSMTDQKLKEILQDHKTITGFTFRYMEDKYKKLKWGINLYFLLKIRDIAKEIGGGIFVYLREGRELFPHSRSRDPAKKVLSDCAEDVIKDCRKAGVKILIDTQSPFDVPDEVMEQCSHRIILRHNMLAEGLMKTFSLMKGITSEHVKSIKELDNFHFFVSYPGCKMSLENGRIKSGRTLLYKLSDHLEEKENELGELEKIIPKEKWYKTAEYFDALVENWRASVDQLKSLKKRYDWEKERREAMREGINLSDKKLLKALYLGRNKSKGLSHTEIRLNTGLAKSTCADAIARQINEGRVIQLKNGNYFLTEGGIDFVDERKDFFEIKENIV